MPLPRAVARFNRRVANPVVTKFAGRVPLMANLRHVGRASGREYEVPVVVFERDGGYVIPLTYGPNTDWVKNVRAAGGCEIRARGRVVRLTNPRIVTDPRNRWAPRAALLFLKVARATEHMRLDLADSQS